MKTIQISILFFVIIFKSYAKENNSYNDIEIILNELIIETNDVLANFESKNNKIHQELKKIRVKLYGASNINEKISLLIKKTN